MKKKSKVFAISLLAVSFAVSPFIVLAAEEKEEGKGPKEKIEVSVQMQIEGPEISVEENIQVPEECEVTDTDGVIHKFPNADSLTDFLGVCALVVTYEAGYIQDFTFVDFGFGLWLDSINGITTTEDFSKFWALSHNEQEAQVGITDLGVENEDIISLVYPLEEQEPPVEEEEEETDENEEQEEESDGEETDESEEQEEPTPPSSGGGGGGSSGSEQEPSGIDVEGAVTNAVAFLQGQELTVDAVMGLRAAGKSVDISFLETFSGDTAISYAKPILAITAAGEDPRIYPNEDFIAKMLEFADETQLGEESLVNDDMWGILALRSAGLLAEDVVIQNSKNFLLQNQNADGGWSWSVGGTSDTNDTAAAIMALLEAGISKDSTVINNALSYLKAAQNDDGGFPYDPQSSFSTDSDGNSDAWVLMTINKIGEDPLAWEKNGENPLEHLLSLQDGDGGFWWIEPPADFNNKGATADAVVALSGNSFPVHSISVAKEVATSSGGSSGGGLSVQDEPLVAIELEDTLEEQQELIAQEADRVIVLQLIQEELDRITQEALVVEQQLIVLAANQINLPIAEQETEEASFTQKAQDDDSSLIAGTREDGVQAFAAEAAVSRNFLDFSPARSVFILIAVLLVLGFIVWKFRQKVRVTQ